MATELVQCWRCNGLQGLRERCVVCQGQGMIRQEIEPGHVTLSHLRNHPEDDAPRYGLNGEVGPRYANLPGSDNPN